jgi:hypothetical protein
LDENGLRTASAYIYLARQLAGHFAALPQVKAIALGGSTTGGNTDQSSDIDLYIYTQAEIPLENRKEIMVRSGGASRVNLGMNYWGLGDEWFNLPTGIEVDIVYFDAQWMENQLQRVIEKHEASLGYTTCFWHTVRKAHSLYDPMKWLQALQGKASADYPEPLRQNIIALNHPVLRGVIPAYANQIKKAVKRNDLVSVNHRLAVLLASYFDIIFAVNRELHPGEKRLIALALAQCALLPVDFASDILTVIQSSCSADQVLSVHLAVLLDHLDQWLEQQGFQSVVSRTE